MTESDDRDSLEGRYDRIFASLGEKSEESEKRSFDKEEASYQVSTKRLQIAYAVLIGIGALILFSLVLLYCLPIEIDGKREILSSVISSLFSALTLTIGFVAGSSIDNK